MGTKQEPTVLQMSTHQMETVACAAIANTIAGIPALARSPEGRSLLAMLHGALEDRSEGAASLALGLVVAGVAAWEAEARERGHPSALQTFQSIKAEAKGGRCDA